VRTPRRQRQSRAQATTTTAGVYDSQIRFPLSAFGRYFSIRSLKFAIRNYALLFAGTVLFHVAGTWTLPLIDRDEPRFAEASREMIERGDYVIPYFNNQFRFDKPPLTYWAQVASYRIFGQTDFAARFPSTIAAALTALSIFAWGSRIGGQKLGWWAAIIFALSLQTFVHAKAAVADMWLVLFVTLAHWTAYELIWPREHRTSNLKPRTSNFWWWIFYLALALAFLAKGPIGLTPLLTVTATMFWLREPGLAQRFKFIRGIVLTLLIVSLWGIPALVRTHGEFWSIGIGRHVVGRAFTAMGGHGARTSAVYLLLLPFYFLTVFVSFFPWSIKLPWLVSRLRRNRDALDVYLLCGVLIVFGIFTFVTTKLLHYTLPAFPLLALLLARALSAENSTGFLKKCAISAVAIYLGLALLVAPFTRKFFPSWQLFQESRGDLRPEMQFGAVGYNEPSLVWYFRSRVRGWLQISGLHPEKVQQYMEQTGARFIILPTDLALKVYPTLPAGWKEFSAHGYNVVKGKRSDLTLILRPE
jgi:4-amino-4-deoxy-L-arabinose transferase-like glycosyltransferase